jgi:hypothetical protein
MRCFTGSAAKYFYLPQVIGVLSSFHWFAFNSAAQQLAANARIRADCLNNMDSSIVRSFT